MLSGWLIWIKFEVFFLKLARNCRDRAITTCKHTCCYLHLQAGTWRREHGHYQFKPT